MRAPNGSLDFSIVEREKPGVCPACGSLRSKKYGQRSYLDTLRLWTANPEAVAANLGIAGYDFRFEISACVRCGLLYLPTSYVGLTQRVETSSFFCEEVVKGWFDLQQPVVDDSYYQKLIGGAELDNFEQRYVRTMEMLSPFLKGRDLRFLDLGSCLGTLAALVRRRFDLAQVIACETNPYFYEELARRYPTLSLLRGTLAENPDPSTFDFVYCSDVIEHVWDLDAFLASIYARLDAASVIMFVTPDGDCESLKRDGILWSGFNVPHHLQIFNRKSLTGLLRRHGFKTSECHVIDEELVVICKKRRRFWW